MTNKSEFLLFALRLAEAAKPEILSRYYDLTVMTKPDGSEVTEADQNAEKVIRKLIEEVYPDHGILGEEFGKKEGSSSYQWIVDPIDRTSWFTAGIPTFGTLISLVENGKPILGVCAHPAMNEVLYAEEGKGCWFESQGQESLQVFVDKEASFDEATISASGLHNSDIDSRVGKDAFKLSGVITASNKFKFCGDCSQHVLVARGRIHAAIDTLMKPWDIAALAVCVREAGGVVCGLDGSADNILYAGNLLSGANQDICDKILSLV